MRYEKKERKSWRRVDSKFQNLTRLSPQNLSPLNPTNITNNLYFKTPSKCTATSHSNRILAEGYMSARRKRGFAVEPGEMEECNCYVREKMNRVTLLFDKIPPVLHKLAQGDQRVLRYGKLVVSSPGFHGNQYYPSLKLVFIDLGQ